MKDTEGLKPREIFGLMKSSWDTDRLKKMLEDRGLGYEGVVEIFDDLRETGDSRTKMKLAQLILEIGGALQQKDTGDTNIMINNIINAPQKVLDQLIRGGEDVLDAEVKNIETKGE